MIDPVDMIMNPIRRIRYERNMTVKAFAEWIGLKESQVYRYQRGDSQYLSVRVMNALQKLGFDAIEVQREYVEWRKTGDSSWRLYIN